MSQYDQHTANALDAALGRLYQAKPPAGFEQGWREAVIREEQQSMQKNDQPRKQGRFWRIAAPIAAALVLVVGSLWAGTQSPTAGKGDMAAPSAVSRSKTSTANDTSSLAIQDGELYYINSESLPMGSVPQTDETADTAVAGAAVERKLVRTVSLTIESTAFDSDLSTLRQRLQALGGYIEDEYIIGGAGRSAALAMRVPAEQVDTFLSGLEGIGRVTARRESTEDMTLEYTDIESRLTTYRATLDRLRELLGKAEQVADIVEIESKIGDIQYEIDRYDSRQRVIDHDVDMCSVNITLREETPAQSAAAETKSLGERLSAAFQASLAGIGEFFRNMLVFLVMAAPVIVPLAVAAVVVWLVCRAKKKKAAAVVDADEQTKE